MAKENQVLEDYLAGSTEPWAASVIAAIVRLKKPRRILELGTFEGRTTQAIAAAMPDYAKLTTVDHQIRHDGFDDPRIRFYKEDAITFLRDMCPQMDLVFVDDDHNYGHVSTEITLIKERVLKPGGMIIMHDVIGPFGLDKIVEREGGFIIELPLLHAAGGLGVIQCQ